MKKTLLLLITLLTLFTASSVFGEIRGGELNGSFFVGGYTFDSSQHFKTNIARGLRLGYDITKNFGVETQFTEVTLKSSREGDSRRGDQYSARGDLIYHFMPESKLVPFVVLGGGVSKITKFYGGNTDGTLDYGVGVKYFVTDWLALRMDVRQILSFQSGSSRKTNYWENYEYTAGLSVQFDRAAEAIPAAEEVSAPAPIIMAAPLPASSQPATAAPAAAPAPVRVLEPAPAPAAVTAAAEPPDSVPAARKAAVKSSAKCNCSQQALAKVVLGSDNVEIVTDIGFDTYNVFQLTEPTRLVIDICCTNDGMGSKASTYAFNRWGVSTVRVAGHPDKLRVVLDTTLSRFPGYRIETTATGIKILMNDW